MTEIEEALQDAARLGYKAAENGQTLEDVIKNITVTGEQA